MKACGATPNAKPIYRIALQGRLFTMRQEGVHIHHQFATSSLTGLANMITDRPAKLILRGEETYIGTREDLDAKLADFAKKAEHDDIVAKIDELPVSDRLYYYRNACAKSRWNQLGMDGDNGHGMVGAIATEEQAMWDSALQWEKKHADAVSAQANNAENSPGSCDAKHETVGADLGTIPPETTADESTGGENDFSDLDPSEVRKRRRVREYEAKQHAREKRTPQKTPFKSKQRQCASCGTTMWTTQTRRMLCGQCYRKKTDA